MVQRRRRQGAIDTSGWLTRDAVATALSVSPQTIMNYEQRKLLHPKLELRHLEGRGVREVYVYNPHEVTRLPHRRLPEQSARDSGEVAARCFELFDQGLSFRRVVVAARVTPDEVRELHEEWLDMGGSDDVITATAKAEIETYIGPFEGVAGLVTRLMELFPGHE